MHDEFTENNKMCKTAEYLRSPMAMNMFINNLFLSVVNIKTPN